MSVHDGEVYYWIKLRTDFYNRPEIKILKKRINGEKYLHIYLKLLLMAANTGGLMTVNGGIPCDLNMIAAITDESADYIIGAMEEFKSLGLVTFLEDGIMYIPDAPEMVGSETYAAKRSREYRANKLMELELEAGANAPDCNTEIEQDTDIEIE